MMKKSMLLALSAGIVISAASAAMVNSTPDEGYFQQGSPHVITSTAGPDGKYNNEPPSTRPDEGF